MYSQEYFDQLATVDDESEVLSQFLRLAGLNLDAAELTRMIGCDRFNLRTLLAKNFSTLEQEQILGGKGAVFLKLLHILILQFHKNKIQNREVISSYSELYSYLTIKMSTLPEEQVILLVLDSGNQLLCEVKIASGMPNCVFVHPGQIIKKLIERNASAFILVHNHPSGSTRPSSEDIDNTRELDIICKKLSITFHDHLIVGGDKVISMRSSGFFDEKHRRNSSSTAVFPSRSR